MKKSPLKKGNYQLKKSPLRSNPKPLKKNIKVKEYSSSMKDFFLGIWDNIDKPVRCYETGVVLGEQYRENSSIYHHMLHKSRYPEFALDIRNICILHPDVHNQVHANIDHTPKVKKLTEEISELLLGYS